MYVLFRLLKTLVASAFGASLDLLDASAVSFRVWPNDFDTNGHMNNGRYLTLMDLGRWDLVVRVGLFKQARRRKWYPVVASPTIRFRRALRPFQKYRIVTRIACWDEKWVFLDQRFEQGGDLVALGVIKGLIRDPVGNVPTRAVLASLGRDPPSPPMPLEIRLSRDSEAAAQRPVPPHVPNPLSERPS